MEKVGSFDAKTNLPKLIDRVMKGESITITRHGVPVAILTPPEPLRRDNPETVIAEIRRFRKKHNLSGLSLRAMIEEGRR